MGDSKSSFLVFGGLVAAVILLIYLVSGDGNRRLEASAIGTNGLYTWLQASDVEVAQSHRRVELPEDNVSLRLLPLFDTDLLAEERPPVDNLEQRAQTTQREIALNIVMEKTVNVRSLVMLPKWRTGVTMLSVAHDSLLIPEGHLERLLNQLGLPKMAITRPDVTLLEATTDGQGDVVLYEPQVFDRRFVKGICTPYLSIPEGVLIARCTLPKSEPLFLLSDPDLMNNHGLTLGDNATVALNAIKDIAAEREGIVYHDTSDEILLSWEGNLEREARPRTADDLSRYFTYPFSLLWLGTGFLFLIAFWRGLIRFGPPARVDNDEVGASKTASIEAKAYLLRLTGQDHALVAEFANNRINDLSSALLGKHVGQDRTLLFKRLKAIAPSDAGHLEEAMVSLNTTDAQTPAGELMRRIETFEESYRRIRDELGNVSRRR
ncbi:hypothetical protein [Aliiroseovarius sp. YM-037]|uniref:hypothetical protein n=1 Tax=Aliiroseovarius sp. YM-037 TaxID=3341728 RepID=UPI003A807A31